MFSKFKADSDKSKKAKFHFALTNKQDHMKVLLNCFHFNSHAMEFHSQTKVGVTLYGIINSTT